MKFLKVLSRTDRWLQRKLFPHRRNILVDARTPLNFDIVEPIYREMQRDKRVRFWFTASETPQKIHLIYQHAGNEIRLIHPRKAFFMPFDVYLASDFMWAPLARRAIRIQMFHGVAGKYGFDTPDASAQDWHHYFFINSKRMENYRKAGIIGGSGSQGHLTGMPKMDKLVNGTFEREKVLESLGLDAAKPVVLYAPTWSPYSSLNRMGEPLVKNLLDAGYSVILKLHDGSRRKGIQYSGGIDWPGRFKEMFKGVSAVVAEGTDSCPYLAASDVMITDHSSIGFEFMLLDRPVIRIEIPELLSKAQVHPDYIHLMEQGALTVHHIAEVLEAVKRELSDPGCNSTNRKKVAAELFFQPGSATERTVAALYEIMELEPLKEAPVSA